MIVKRADQTEDGSEKATMAGADLETIRYWFRTYKVAEGCPENEFVFDGQMKDADYAHHIINEAHDRWQTLGRRIQ